MPTMRSVASCCGRRHCRLCSRADISEFEKRRSSEASTREYEGVVEAAQHAIEDSPSR
jgi:hypothetical protein